MKTVTVVAGQTIDLGYQYDNYATEVVFPSDIVTPFITNFGSSGIFAIWYRRSGDSLGYPIGDPLVTFDSSNNTITWQVVEADTANPGTAQVQLRYIIDEVCVMSQMFTGVVSDSVDVGEEVPEPMEQWADAIVVAGAGGQPVVATSVSAMSNHSTIYLYMGFESGYVYNHVYYWNGSAWTDGGAYGGGSAGSGLTEDVKQALLACFENVAWVSEDGQDYVDALESALYPPANLLRITAVYTQSGTVYDTDTLDSLKSDLVVTANYEDGTSSEVSNYTLSGTLAEGTSTITVTYGGKTATFDVVVTSATLYPLPDKVTETSYYKLTTTSDGHVELEVKQNWTIPNQGQGVAINLLTGECGATNGININNKPKTFTFPANASIRWGTKNVVNALSTGYTGNFRIANSSSSTTGLTLAPNGYITDGNTVTATIESETNIYYPFFYVSTGTPAPAGTKLSFDMFVYVNDVRYI